jgi:hypothetical protein
VRYCSGLALALAAQGSVVSTNQGMGRRSVGDGELRAVADVACLLRNHVAITLPAISATHAAAPSGAAGYRWPLPSCVCRQALQDSQPSRFPSRCQGRGASGGSGSSSAGAGPAALLVGAARVALWPAG